MGLLKHQNSGPASPASHLTIHPRCSVHNLGEGRWPSLPLQPACLFLPTLTWQSPLFSSVQAAAPLRPDFEALPAGVPVSTGISGVLPLVPPHRHHPCICLNPLPLGSSSPCPTSSHNRFSISACRTISEMGNSNSKNTGGGSRRRGHRYIYSLFMLMFGRNQHNTVKQLSFN